MGGKKGPKRPLLEFEIPAIDALFVAVVEATKEAANNASLDDHRVETLPGDATLATL